MVAGPLARRPGRRAARHRGGERRRPPGGLGRRCGRPGALGRRRPALAARCGGLPLVRRSHRLRRRRFVGLRDGLRVRPARPVATLAAGRTRSATGTRTASGRGRRRDVPTGSGPTGGRSRSGCCCPVASTIANALMAAVAAEAMGIAAADGSGRDGRCRRGGGTLHHPCGGRRAHPAHAGQEPRRVERALDLVGKDDGPIVISINARTADGADPSWLWDVPFERLAPRVVVATGDRCRDLSVRLHYAGVAHVMEADPLDAVRRRTAMTAHATATRQRSPGRCHRQLHRLRRAARTSVTARRT